MIEVVNLRAETVKLLHFGYMGIAFLFIPENKHALAKNKQYLVSTFHTFYDPYYLNTCMLSLNLKNRLMRYV